jgi:hypothetical protein
MAAKIIPRSAAKPPQPTDTPKYTEEQENLRRGTDFLWRIVRASNIGHAQYADPDEHDKVFL